MHVGLITYQTGHRKTLEVTLKLLSKGYRVTWYAFPFVRYAPKIGPAPYQDRPPQLLDYDIEAFCREEGVSCRAMGGWSEDCTALADDPDPADIWLHCTAKIVPKHFLDGRRVLNVHAGLLPKNRGVDAFKWSLIKGWPIGVTLHAIDETIDGGTILFRRTVPILATDKFEDLCRRMYDFECDLLANFDAHLGNLSHGWQVGDTYPISHSRIPKDMECRLEDIFLSRMHKRALVA